MSDKMPRDVRINYDELSWYEDGYHGSEGVWDKYTNTEQLIEAVRGMEIGDLSVGGMTQRTYGQNEGYNQALEDVIEVIQGS